MLTSIDMLGNSPALVSYWIIYVLQWNINVEFYNCRHENKAEDSFPKYAKLITNF